MTKACCAKIDQALSAMNENEKKLHAQALAEGYKDELCPECGVVFLAFHHFIRCQSETCPMKLRDGGGHAPTFLEMLENGVPGGKTSP
jgi:hypothetical protein